MSFIQNLENIVRLHHSKDNFKYIPIGSEPQEPQGENSTATSEAGGSGKWQKATSSKPLMSLVTAMKDGKVVALL